MTQSLPNFGDLPFSTHGRHPDINRFNWRWEMLFVRNQDVIRNQRVLDLACNTGRMSYPCLKLGAKRTVGVEARADLIATGRSYFSELGFGDRMEWHKADVFDFLASSDPGSFDVILCLGFLYHTVRQVEFFRELRRLGPKTVIVDTSVSKNYVWYGSTSFLRKPPALFVAIEDPSKSSDTTDEDGVVFWPSCSFLEKMFDVNGFRARRIRYTPKDIKDWAGLGDYKKGIRASYIASRVP